MPDNVASLRRENNALKVQLNTLSEEVAKLKELLTQQCSSDANGDHDNAPTSEETAQSLQFISKQYDDLHRFQKAAKEELHRLNSRLAQVESKLDAIANSIDELEDYSYQFLNSV